MEKRLLNTKEACEYVGLSKNELYTLIKARNFPFINISRGKKNIYRFDVLELDGWIDRLK